MTVLTPNYGAARREQIEAVEILRFPFPKRLPPGQGSVPVRWHANPLFWLQLSGELYRVARRIRPHVMVACLRFSMLPVLAVGRVVGAKCIVEVRDPGYGCPITTCLFEADRIPADCGHGRLWRHCSDYYFERYVLGGWRRRMRTKVALTISFAAHQMMLRCLRRFDGAVFVSTGLMDLYRRSGLLPLAPERVAVRYSTRTLEPSDFDIRPTDTRRRYGLDGRRLVLYAGKLSLGKGTPVLARAAARVADVRDDVTFVLAGKGGGPLEAGRADLRLLGVRSRQELAQLYAVADVVVHPSVYPEPLPQNLIDAGSFGRAAVASAVGGNPEVVRHEETGLLVPPGDPAALAAGLLRLLDDEALRDRLGRNARRAVLARFDEERIIADFLRFCHHLGADDRPPRGAFRTGADHGGAAGR